MVPILSKSSLISLLCITSTKDPSTIELQIEVLRYSAKGSHAPSTKSFGFLQLCVRSHCWIDLNSYLFGHKDNDFRFFYYYVPGNVDFLNNSRLQPQFDNIRGINSLMRKWLSLTVQSIVQQSFNCWGHNSWGHKKASVCFSAVCYATQQLQKFV